MRHRSLILAVALPLGLGACAHDRGIASPPTLDACTGADEAACLRRTEGSASRAGDVLTLKTGPESTASFTSLSRACAEGIARRCVLFRLEGYRPEQGLFVVAERHFGGMRYLVVDGRSGGIARVDGDTPRFSPSGTRFAAVSGARVPPGEPDLAVWSLGEDGPRMDWSHRGEPGAKALYGFLGWEGEDKVVLRVRYVPTGGGPQKEDAAAIVMRDGGWTLEKPADCP